MTTDILVLSSLGETCLPLHYRSTTHKSTINIGYAIRIQEKAQNVIWRPKELSFWELARKGLPTTRRSIRRASKLTAQLHDQSFSASRVECFDTVVSCMKGIKSDVV